MDEAAHVSVNITATAATVERLVDEMTALAAEGDRLREVIASLTQALEAARAAVPDQTSGQA